MGAVRVLVNQGFPDRTREKLKKTTEEGKNTQMENNQHYLKDPDRTLSDDRKGQKKSSTRRGTTHTKKKKKPTIASA